MVVKRDLRLLGKRVRNSTGKTRLMKIELEQGIADTWLDRKSTADMKAFNTEMAIARGDFECQDASSTSDGSSYNLKEDATIPIQQCILQDRVYSFRRAFESVLNEKMALCPNKTSDSKHEIVDMNLDLIGKKVHEAEEALRLAQDSRHG